MNAKRAHLCSAFYERMKEVREYHRRYPYLEVAEVSAACPVSILAAPLWCFRQGPGPDNEAEP